MRGSAALRSVTSRLPHCTVYLLCYVSEIFKKKSSQRKSEREKKRKKQMVKVEIFEFSIIRNRFSFTFILFRCCFLFSHVLSFLFLDDYHFASSSPALRYNLPSSSVGFSSLSLTHLCRRYARVRFKVARTR